MKKSLLYVSLLLVIILTMTATTVLQHQKQASSPGRHLLPVELK